MLKNSFLILALFLLSCQSNKLEEPTSAIASEVQWPDGVAYEIFVQSFYDANGDGIGDIKGMTQKMDYLTELGVDAIWLMPIMPSPSYHKYDVVDYYGIHPDYGTMEDFKAFLAEAHSNNIKVIIDLVINHTGSDHPWFLDAKSSPDSKYRDFYVWADKDSIAEQIAKKTISHDSDNIRQWHPVDGDTIAEHYYGFFWGGMPDLNFDNPEVRKEIFKIGRYWLEEIGVDGFRLDAAKHIFPDERAADNHAFWKSFKSEMEKIDPDVYLVGEIWADAATTAPYAAGFDAFFNFDLAYNILETVDNGVVVNTSIAGHSGGEVGDSSFISSLISNRKVYTEYNPDYQDAIFLSNHDQNRVMSVFNNDVNKAKVAAAILLTLPGTPYLYYGEEIGMRGKKPDEEIREPFFWSTTATEGTTSWRTPIYNIEGDVTPLDEQKDDENSLYNHYKALLSLRKENPALLSGELLKSPIQNPKVLSFIRKSGDQEFLILHNISTESVVIPLPQVDMTLEEVSSFNGSVDLSEKDVALAPYSTAVISMN